MWVALTATPITAPVVPFTPAREVDGDDRRAAGVHHDDHGARQALDLAVEPGAEQRVDDQVAIAERRRRGVLDRTGPALGSDRRVALEPLAIADKVNPHRAAAAPAR